MLRRLTLAACLVVALVAPGFARARPLILIVGDSTSYGAIDDHYGQADVTTAETLQAILRVAGKENPYRRAKVRNFGVPGASTGDWVVGPVNQTVCDTWASVLAFLARACARGVPLLAMLPPKPTALLVTLGYADGIFGIPVEQTVANLAAIEGRMPDSAIFIAPPFVPTYLKAERDLRRMALLEAGLVSGPDWPPLPLVDGVHLTPGAYAAVAGLWLDVLQ